MERHRHDSICRVECLLQDEKGLVKMGATSLYNVREDFAKDRDCTADLVNIQPHGTAVAFVIRGAGEMRRIV